MTGGGGNDDVWGDPKQGVKRKKMGEASRISSKLQTKRLEPFKANRREKKKGKRCRKKPNMTRTLTVMVGKTLETRRKTSGRCRPLMSFRNARNHQQGQENDRMKPSSGGRGVGIRVGGKRERRLKRQPASGNWSTGLGNQLGDIDKIFPGGTGGREKERGDVRQQKTRRRKVQLHGTADGHQR